MQQIKFDSLVSLNTAAQNAAELKLDSTQFYPARLTINQPALLQIQAGNGQLQVLLSAEQVKHILQSSHTATQVSTPSNLTAAATDSTHSEMSSKAAAPASAVISTTSGGDAGPAAIKLLVRLAPTITGDIQLTVQPLAKPIQVPLNSAQLIDMLRQPPLAAGQTISAAAMQLTNAVTALSVQVTKLDSQLQVQLDGQASFRLPLAQTQGTQRWPEGKTITAQLQVSASGQLTLHPVQSGSKAPVAAESATDNQSSGRPTSSTPHVPVPSVLLSDKASKQLLPLFAQQRWPERLSSQLHPWLAANLAPAQSAGTNTASPGNTVSGTPLPQLDMLSQQKPALRWQLSTTTNHFLLQLQPDTEPLQLKFNLAEFNRPLSFHPQLMPNQPTPPELSKDLWRQLLPLSPGQLDPLADSPQLAVPARQLLQWVRQQQPDGKHVLDTPQLQQQLTAALQFQPISPAPNTNTAAGAIALAISMLLGRLANLGQAEKSQLAGKEKLAQIIGQLDNNQSSQLLKQLAGHSGALQAAQIATLEQPATKTAEQPLFIQLPLQCDMQSRMAELCITEQDSQDGPAGQRQRQWQLTMKFNLGSAGELLAKVTLRQQQISLQFYTDQAATIQMAEKFLPLLKDRLKVQGVEVTDVGCQLGRIPEHLYRQGTSLLQVRV